jgi:hypothetical protein
MDSHNPQPANDADMTPEEKRRDQLLSAPNAVESDADPRIEVSEHDGVTRIDISPDAAVRPGNPYEEHDEARA